MGTAQIVVGVDGSPASRRAAQKAAELARTLEGSVRVVAVEPRLLPPAADVSPSLWKELDAVRRAEALQAAREVASGLSDQGFSAEAELRVGQPADELCRLAEGDDVALLVVGRGGKGGVRSLLAGSVARRLASTAPKPLVIVP